MATDPPGDVTTEEVISRVWHLAAKGSGLPASELEAVVREAVRQLQAAYYLPPSWRWHIFVPYSYAYAWSGTQIMGVGFQRRDVPRPVLVLLPEGVDSL